MYKISHVKHEDLGLDFEHPSKEMSMACSNLAKKKKNNQKLQVQ